MDYNIIFRSAAVYIFMIIAIRLAGKKELSQLSATDLVFIILIGNALQNAMIGEDNTLIGGLIAASTLFILNYVFKLAMFKSQWFKKVVEGEPVLLINEGVLNLENLDRMKISIPDLNESIREHGIDDHSKIKLAMLEVDGKISVISFENNKVKRSYHKRKKD